MESTETKTALTICFVVACFVGLCLKGCSISENKAAEVIKYGMDKGYVQVEQVGQAGLKWVKDESKAAQHSN
jgi:hypothetical protein